ncbi:MAG: discoidin domain-containing protein [bacterium]|nr:discoidin domain-containing protein [bacterium]
MLAFAKYSAFLIVAAGLGFAGTYWFLNKSSQDISLTNLALGKPTLQSSYHKRYKSSPVDGRITGKNSFITKKENRPWWQVDLQALHELSQIKIYNVKGKYSKRAFSVDVLVSQHGDEWTTVYLNKGVPFGGKGMKMGPLIVDMANSEHRLTRYVRLQLAKKNMLHLDEVMVFGKNNRAGG